MIPIMDVKMLVMTSMLMSTSKNLMILQRRILRAYHTGISWDQELGGMSSMKVPDSEKPNYMEKMEKYSAWLKEMRGNSNNT